MGHRRLDAFGLLPEWNIGVLHILRLYFYSVNLFTCLVLRAAVLLPWWPHLVLSRVALWKGPVVGVGPWFLLSSIRGWQVLEHAFLFLRLCQYQRGVLFPDDWLAFLDLVDSNSDGDRVPDLPSGGDKQRFDGERHTDPASDHTDPNPATLAPRLLWLSTMSRSG